MMSVIILIEKIFLAISAFSCIAISLLAIFFRYFLQNALPWPEEITGFLLIGITVFGAGLAFKYNQHASVDLINYLISRTKAHLLSLLAGMISFLISIMVTVQSIKMVVNLYETTQYCASLEYLPLWIPLLTFPAGFIFISLHCLEIVLNKIKR
jgi:TRAP-type C4-dicarboxylate transport system permease small subunit